MRHLGFALLHVIGMSGASLAVPDRKDVQVLVESSEDCEAIDGEDEIGEIIVAASGGNYE